MALQVCHQTERLAALGATVTPHLGVYLEGERIRERLETQSTVVEVFRVCLFMVEKGTSMAVGAPTQITPTEGI